MLIILYIIVTSNDKKIKRNGLFLNSFDFLRLLPAEIRSLLPQEAYLRLRFAEAPARSKIYKKLNNI